MDAETAYCFRHAVLRDAAYQLQLPGDRARLHAMALEIMESAARVDDLASGVWSGELAEHARGAAQHADEAQGAVFRQREARYRARYGEYLDERFDLPGARAQLELAVALSCEAPVRARAWKVLGEVRRKLGDMEGALDAISRAMGEGQFEPVVRGTLNIILHNICKQIGRTAQAAEAAQQALADFRAAGDREREASALGSLANLFCEAGELDRAEPLYRQALEIFVAGRREREMALCLSGLALTAKLRGRTQEALECMAQAETIHRKREDKRALGILLNNKAYLHGEEVRREILLEALSLHRQALNRRSEGVALADLAETELGAGRLAQAEAFLEQALPILRETRNIPHLAMAHVYQGRLSFQRGNGPLAMSHFEQALQLASEARHRDTEADALWHMAPALQALGRTREAVEMLTRAGQIFDSLGNPVSAAAARDLAASLSNGRA